MFRWATDTSGGDWVRNRLGPFGSAVGSVVPRGFDAYARVLHRVRVASDVRAQVDAVLADPTPEAFELGADDSLAYDADEVNR